MTVEFTPNPKKLKIDSELESDGIITITTYQGAEYNTFMAFFH